ncbi:Transposase IS200 like protein [Marinomonas gallaica]|uniref:Transposase IS200 like protein n=1 Tax=Marinomonas gallaica TaxID=1806667 RepID=A0A1C3JMJ2_9GAMM|nr:transposase [Marinomonas gallaica]SBT16432.1 Transposase IS200 like protein [Marinomonas gallaica]SBT21480.1 Transposase IS200 like protein [Marinomonas gallaica]
MKGYSNLRKGRCSDRSVVYHLTFASLNRVQTFKDFLKARAVIKALAYCDCKQWGNTVAFVIMPNHVHWLVQPYSKNISELVRVVKEYTRKHYGVLWQKSFYDRGMRSEQETIETARYIIANPKRAGLVSHVGQYSHWDCIYL